MDVDTGGASSNGGYIEPARMVNVVHKTNCAHHPDCYDPTPVEPITEYCELLLRMNKQTGYITIKQDAS